MRHTAVLLISLGCLLFFGCLCADFGLFWTVDGEVVDADTGEPLPDAMVQVHLIWDEMAGQPLGFSLADAAGRFEADSFTGSSGSCGLLFLMPPPSRPLGSPPDRIEIIVQTVDGRQGSTIVPVTEDSVAEINELRGVPLSGSIKLGRISVPTAPRVDERTLGTGFLPQSIDIGDLNSDGSLDLVVTNQLSENVSVLFNMGNGRFADHVVYAVERPAGSIGVGDLNGDERLDLAIGSQLGEIAIFFNQGEGVLTRGTTLELEESPHDIEIADLNGDEVLDLVVGLFGGSVGNDVSILLNDGSGTFGTDVAHQLGEWISFIATADMDADDLIDVAVIIFDTVFVMLNDGNGSFDNVLESKVSGSPVAGTVADLDGDGDNDLAVIISGHGVSILLNNGDGTLGDEMTLGEGASSGFITADDMDGDGDIDLILTLPATNEISILLNIGDGAFEPAVNHQVGNWPVSVATGDLDGNGCIDAAVVNYWDSTVSLLLDVAVGPGTTCN